MSSVVNEFVNCKNDDLKNNNFPVERGARENIPRRLRICTYCNDGSIGDEFPLPILQCKHFPKDRLLYLKCR